MSRTVRCPACGGRSVYAPSQPFRPFCSERCRSADFGAWATGAYRVGGADADADSEDLNRVDAGDSAGDR